MIGTPAIGKPTPIYRVWLERVAAEGITYGHLRQFCEAIVGDGGRRTNLTVSEKDDLYLRAEKRWAEGGYDLWGGCLNGDWKRYGNEWLARNGAKLAVEDRTDLQRCPEWVIDAARINSLDFRWVGITEDHGTYRSNVKPVYRAIAIGGDFNACRWDYYAYPWQRRAYR